MANAFEPVFEPDEPSPLGFTGRHARIGRAAGSERLGASIYELLPGQSVCPYHWHAANEELLIVLRGTPSLRTPQGIHELAEGEVVAFPVGEEGAHKVSNEGSEPARVLVVSEMNAPDVCVYPDSNKVMARQQAPGTPATGLRVLFRLEDEVDYWDREVDEEEGS